MRSSFEHGSDKCGNWTGERPSRNGKKKDFERKGRFVETSLWPMLTMIIREVCEAFWKLVNGLVKSSDESRIESSIDCRGNGVWSGDGKLRILRLESELHVDDRRKCVIL